MKRQFGIYEDTGHRVVGNLKTAELKMKRITDKLKKIKYQDITGVFLFILVLIPAMLKRLSLKRAGKQLWLVSEHGTARDNGYCFYKYLREEHPELDIRYAMYFEGNDYRKMRRLGGLIKWGGLKHYYYYMAATWNVTSHKNGNPNQMIFTVLQKLGFFNNVIFLQHGVLYQDFPMFHRDRCSFRLFICGASPEYEFVKDRYGYRENEVKYTGLARFDQLYDAKTDSRMILFIPTWRRWLSDRETFGKSEYYRRTEEVLCNPQLEELLKATGKTLFFYPHMGSWEYADMFRSDKAHIRVLDPRKTDIQKLLMKGAVMITDYSSICTDFAYMGKPVIYYQYDHEEYIRGHCLAGQKYTGKWEEYSYFDFERDGFGPVVHSVRELTEQLEVLLQKGFKVSAEYKERTTNFFGLKDTHNCDRIYGEIMQLDR